MAEQPSTDSKLTSDSQGQSPLIGLQNVIFSATLLLVAWVGLRAFGGVGDILPSVGDLLSTVYDLEATSISDDMSFWSHLGTSTWHLTAAWVGGTALGLLGGWLVGSSTSAHRLFSPAISFMRFVVPTAAVGVFVNWLGIGHLLVISLSGLLPFWIAVDGMARIRRRHLNGSISRDPAALEELIWVARTALLVSFSVLSSFEVLAGVGGLGAFTRNAATFDQPKVMYFGFLSQAALGMTFDYLVRGSGKLYERRVIGQQRSVGEARA